MFSNNVAQTYLAFANLGLLFQFKKKTASDFFDSRRIYIHRNHVIIFYEKLSEACLSLVHFRFL